MKTELAKYLEGVESSQAAYDQSAKALFSHRQILARLIQDLIPGFQLLPAETIEQAIEQDLIHSADEAPEWIVGLNTESSAEPFGKIQHDLLTIVNENLSDQLKPIIINIEFQNEFSPGYPLLKRAVHYASRMIVSQKNKFYNGDNYQDSRPVWSIWICPKPPRNAENTITEYYLSKKQRLGHGSLPGEEERLYNIVFICPGDPDRDNYTGLVKFTGTLLSTSLEAEEKELILEKEFGMRMSEEVKTEVENMNYISDYILEEGEQRGLQKGLQKGLKEGEQKGLKKGVQKGRTPGIQEGTLRTLKSTVSSLMEKTGMGFSQACDLLGVSQKDQKTLLSVLSEDMEKPKDIFSAK